MTAPAPPRSKTRLLRWFWPAAVLLQAAGLLFGYWYFHYALADAQAQVRHAAEARKFVRAPEPTPAPRAANELLDRADKLMRSGRYDQALPVYEAVRAKAEDSFKDLADYRKALCLEGLGQWDWALGVYRVLATRNPNPRAVIAAAVGQGRTLLRAGKAAEAKELLCHVLLRSSQFDRVNPDAIAEGRYLLALAFTQEVTPPATASHFVGDVVRAGSIRWEVEHSVAWADPPQPEKEKKTGAKKAEQDGTLKVQRIPIRPELSLITVSIAGSAVQPLLDNMAQRSGLRNEWSAAALRCLGGHEITVRMGNAAYQDIATLVAGHFGLWWEGTSGTWHWRTIEEGSAADIRAFRFATAHRALQETSLAYANQYLLGAALLNLGNLEVWSGNLQAAAAWYEQMPRVAEHSPVLVDGNYNFGLVQHRLGNDTAAERSLYRVVDMAPEHELAPRAYLAIGRIWLQAGEPTRAISPLRRALSAAPGITIQPDAIITLAATYLWAGDPRAANAVMFAHRATLNGSNYKKTAAFLDSFSRFLVAGDRRQTRHSGDLLATILTLGTTRDLQAVGDLLVGLAYRELGMTEQMTTAYEKAVRDIQGPIAEEMSFILANGYTVLHRDDAAQKILLSLAVLERSKWAAPAKFRLAEIALGQNRPKDALLWGRQLLSIQAPRRIPALLTLLGKAYEQTGELEQAARCFAGHRPL